MKVGGKVCTQPGCAARLEIYSGHRVFQSSRKLANAALDVDMEIGATQSLVARGPGIEEPMGDFFDSEPRDTGCGQRRQHDLDADYVSVYRGRPENLRFRRNATFLPARAPGFLAIADASVGFVTREMEVCLRDRLRHTASARMEETHLGTFSQTSAHAHPDGGGFRGRNPKRGGYCSIA